MITPERPEHDTLICAPEALADTLPSERPAVSGVRASRAAQRRTHQAELELMHELADLVNARSRRSRDRAKAKSVRAARIRVVAWCAGSALLGLIVGLLCA